jgi:hypothetical protein
VSAQISDDSSTASPDADLVALVEKRFVAWALIRQTNDEEVDPIYDEMDRLDELIAATLAHTLVGVRSKAGICRTLARGDIELAWPMLRSLMADLQHLPLDDQATLRSIFTELALPLPS